VSGTVTVPDNVAADVHCKLWDGTTVIASAIINLNPTPGGASGRPVALSGYITNPVGNLRISCKDVTNTTGKIVFNATGNSADSTISAIRIA